MKPTPNTDKATKKACLHCKKDSGQHNAMTKACPMPGRGQFKGFHRSLTYEPKPLKIRPEPATFEELQTWTAGRADMIILRGYPRRVANLNHLEKRAVQAHLDRYEETAKIIDAESDRRATTAQPISPEEHAARLAEAWALCIFQINKFVL